MAVDPESPCNICRKPVTTAAFEIWGDDEFVAALCSPSCLVEWAWKEKESQAKLSKSKAAQTPQ